MRHPQLTVEGERLVYEVRVVVVVVHQFGDVRVHLLHRQLNETPTELHLVDDTSEVKQLLCKNSPLKLSITYMC